MATKTYDTETARSIADEVIECSLEVERLEPGDFVAQEIMALTDASFRLTDLIGDIEQRDRSGLHSFIRFENGHRQTPRHELRSAVVQWVEHFSQGF